MHDEPSGRDLLSAILELHSAVSLGFERVEERFKGVDKRFTKIEAEVAGLQRWMARSDERFAALEAR